MSPWLNSALAGRLVALNVGLPRDVEWHGRTVHTGVWKSPVVGPRMVRTLNIDGDGQGDLAGHGGPNRAVMVYQLDSYAHWQQEFGLDGYEYGQFGENFTVEGLPDDEVCIGDQFEIGEALFEVSQPRVTCYRVGLRMGQPRLPSLLVSHRRPGFYLRVLREGHVEAGPADQRSSRAAPERMSVAEVDGLLYLPGHDRADVERASRLPALSPGWVGSFEAILDAPARARPATSACPAKGFPRRRRGPAFAPSSSTTSCRRARQWCRCASRAPTARPFLQQCQGNSSPCGCAWPATGRRCRAATRCPARPARPTYRISVKREEHGLVSAYIYSAVKAGARSKWPLPAAASSSNRVMARSC